jgi:hypothetical protein
MVAGADEDDNDDDDCCNSGAPSESDASHASDVDATGAPAATASARLGSSVIRSAPHGFAAVCGGQRKC